jgi:hypothetical protein
MRVLKNYLCVSVLRNRLGDRHSAKRTKNYESLMNRARVVPVTEHTHEIGTRNVVYVSGGLAIASRLTDVSKGAGGEVRAATR